MYKDSLITEKFFRETGKDGCVCGLDDGRIEIKSTKTVD